MGRRGRKQIPRKRGLRGLLIEMREWSVSKQMGVGRQMRSKREARVGELLTIPISQMRR